MNQFKVKVGRKQPTSEEIRSKQDFGLILNGAKVGAAVSFFRSSWFYGVVGIASVGVIVGIGSLISNGQHENSTQKVSENNVNKVNEVALEEANDVLLASAENVNTTNVSVVTKAAIPQEDIAKNVKTDVPQSSKKTTTANTEIKEVDKAIEVKEEEEFIKIGATKFRSGNPTISGVQKGDITWETFKNGEILVGEDCTVKQFSIQYTSKLGDKSMTIKGSRIPADVAAELEKLGMNQTIFITNVIAGSKTGDMLRFGSMDLNLKF